MPRFIPLLARKPLREWTPEDYKTYIRGLFTQRTKSKRAAQYKKKKIRDYKVSFRVLKKGGLSFSTKRDPKYVTPEEYMRFPALSGRPESEIFIRLKELDFVIMTHEEAEEVRRITDSIPF